MSGKKKGFDAGGVRALARLLIRLDATGGRIRRIDQADEGAVGARHMAVAGSDARMRRLFPVEASLMAFALERGVIVPDGAGGWCVADAGKAWLARLAAPADAYRRQHQAVEQKIIKVDGEQRPVAVDAAESPLAWLRRRKGRTGAPLICDAQFTAGERLRADFTRAQMMPGVSANWNMVPGRGRRQGGNAGGATGILDSAIAAHARVNAALDAVGPEFADLLIDVCCLLRGLGDIESGNGWPTRSGKLVLQLALTALARHYGYISAPAPARRRLRHWGTDDYRPRLDGEGKAATKI